MNFWVSILFVVIVVLIIGHVSFRSGWTIKLHKVFQALICLVVVVILGTIMWAPLQDQWFKDHPQKKEIPKETKSAQPLPKEKKKPFAKKPKPISETKQNQTYDRPEFGIAPNTIGLQITTKAPQEFQVRIDLLNHGERAAVNLRGKLIIVDQLFAINPISAPFSPANEVDSKTIKFFQSNYSNPLEAPIYAVFTLRYQDKKDLSKRWLFQVWFYKTIEAWVGIKTGNPPPRFVDASDEEKKKFVST